MKLTTTLALFTIASLVGAGCQRDLAKPQAMRLPTISITSPKNGARISTNTVEIVGTTNEALIYINKDPQPVTNGSFRVPIVLMLGQNNFDIVVGNGYSTTTQSLNIERAIPRP